MAELGNINLEAFDPVSAAGMRRSMVEGSIQSQRLGNLQAEQDIEARRLANVEQSNKNSKFNEQFAADMAKLDAETDKIIQEGMRVNRENTDTILKQASSIYDMLKSGDIQTARKAATAMLEGAVLGNTTLLDNGEVARMNDQQFAATMSSLAKAGNRISGLTGDLERIDKQSSANMALEGMRQGAPTDFQKDYKFLEGIGGKEMAGRLVDKKTDVTGEEDDPVRFKPNDWVKIITPDVQQEMQNRAADKEEFYQGVRREKADTMASIESKANDVVSTINSLSNTPEYKDLGDKELRDIAMASAFGDIEITSSGVRFIASGIERSSAQFIQGIKKYPTLLRDLAKQSHKAEEE